MPCRFDREAGEILNYLTLIFKEILMRIISSNLHRGFIEVCDYINKINIRTDSTDLSLSREDYETTSLFSRCLWLG
jgi:hypothetical protein